jgi:hypothetical protein
MKTFTSIILLASALVGLAQATPANIVRRANNVRLCTDQDFGNCGTYNIPAGACWNVPGSINDAISSLDTGGPTCTFFVYLSLFFMYFAVIYLLIGRSDGSCGGASFQATGQNPTVPANFNDAISSVKC